MRPVESESESRGVRNQFRAGSRAAMARRARLRQASLEFLESRTLMATLPAATVTANPTAVSTALNGTENDTTPSIAVDPANSQDMVAIYTRENTTAINNSQTSTYIGLAYSNNGGTSWNSLTVPDQSFIDFGQDQSSGAKFFQQYTDGSVAFAAPDSSASNAHHYFYISYLAHSPSYNSGEIILARFDFSGTAPVFSSITGAPAQNQGVQIINPWYAPSSTSGNPAYTPTLAVDNSTPLSTTSPISAPTGLVFSGGNLLVSSSGNNEVVQFNGLTGAYTSVKASGSSLSAPGYSAIDPSGNLYVAEPGSDSVSLTTSGGTTSTLIQGAALTNPQGMAFSPTTGDLFVVNKVSNSILRYDGATGALKPLNVATGAFVSGGSLDAPDSIVFDGMGNFYVSNSDTFIGNPNNNEVLEYNEATGNLVSTITSGGLLNAPKGLAYDTVNNILYIANSGNSSISKVVAGTTTPVDFVSATIKNQGGLVTPIGLTVDGAGNVLASSSVNNAVYRYAPSGAVNPSGGQAGGSALFATGLLSPTGLAIDASDGLLLIANSGPGTVVSVPETLGTGTGGAAPTTLFASGSGVVAPYGLAFRQGNIYVDSSTDNVLQFSLTPAIPNPPFPPIPGFATLVNPSFAADLSPSAVAYNPNTPNVLYISSGSGNMVVKYNATTGMYLGTFIAPTPSGGTGALSIPGDLTFDSTFTNLYVSNRGNNKVLRFNATTGAFENVAALGGGLAEPSGIVIGPDGNLYVASLNNNEVLVYNPATGAPLASSPFVSAPSLTNTIALNGPTGLVFGSDGNLYVASSANARVLRFAGPGKANPGAPLGVSTPNDGTFTSPVNSTFTDTFGTNPTNAVQYDPYFGNVYVAWTSQDPIASGGFSNSIKLVSSTDQGNTFSSPIIIDNDSLTDNKTHDTNPRLVISQQRLPDPAVYGPGDLGVPGGQVSIVWDNLNQANNHPLGLGLGDITDIIDASRIQNGADAVNVAGTTGGVLGAIAVSGAPNIAVTTSFPVTVNVTDPKFSTVSNVTVQIKLSTVGAAIDPLTLTLVPPPNTGLLPIVLSKANTNTSGGVTNVGPTGTSFGGGGPGGNIGAIFDSFASRNDVGVANPTGSFQPATAADVANLKAVLGKTAAQIQGTWTLLITDNATLGTGQFINLSSFSLNFNSGLTPDLQRAVAETTVRGAVTTPGTTSNSVGVGSDYPNAASTLAVPDIGIGPQPQIVADNTLGSYSPHQGRLYIVYTDRSNATGNPTDNTDIFVAASDDGGATWKVYPANGLDNGNNAVKVNDDNARTDGYSEGGIATGRPQFEPSAAVDQSNGTLIVSYYDGRFDAARSRVATFVSTSIDGGKTFSQSVFANPEETATDAITGNTIDLGPLPDNQSTGNTGPSRDATDDFGFHQGLAVVNGHVFAVWASDQNGGTNGKKLQGIVASNMVIGTGPRIISSTMGPVGPTTSVTTALGNTVTLNPAAGDGSTQANYFVLIFDRPIDPGSISAANIQLFYKDTQGNETDISNQVTGVVPLPSVASDPYFITQDFSTGGAPDPDYSNIVNYNTTTNPFGYTVFLVTFTPQASVGTYSYIVNPTPLVGGTPIEDRIRSLNSTVSAPTLLPTFTNNTTATDPPQAFPVPVPASGIGGSGNPTADQTVSTLTIGSGVINPVTHPGQLIGADATHHATLTLDLSFSIPSDLSIVLASPGGFQDVIPGSSLNIVGGVATVNLGTSLNGSPIDGTYTLTISENVKGVSGTLSGWSLRLPAIQSVSGVRTGNPVDQNANAVGNEAAANGVGPGDAFSAPRTTTTGGGFIDNASKPNASFFSAPYDPNTLPVVVPGPHVVSSSVPGVAPTADNLVQDTTVNAIDVTFDRDMLVSTFTPDQVVRIIGPTGLLNPPQTFASTGPSAIPDSSTPVTSTLTVPSFNNTFPIGHLSVQLNITHTNDSDLTILLTSPTGTTITLLAGIGGASGQNFTNTVLDDTATTSIASGAAPFTGTFQPAEPLGTAFNGQQVQGNWKLTIIDNNVGNGSKGTLNSWSLIATPAFTVAPVNPVAGVARTFQIGFPTQQLSGTYTVTIGPDVEDTHLNKMDTNENAGIYVLDPSRNPNGTSAPVIYSSTTQQPATTPKAITSGSVTTSTITVPDDFTVRGVSVALDINYPNDPDLVATLTAPDGTVVTLFSNLTGGGSTQANFTGTILDDTATTPIGSVTAPYTGRYDPQQSLNTRLVTNHAGGAVNAQGTWTLTITNTGTSSGSFVDWSLILLRPSSVATYSAPVGPQNNIGTIAASNPSGVLDSFLTVPDSFAIQSATVTLDITYPNDPDLEATLTSPFGTVIQLFKNVGATGTRANFTGTIFSDAASTPIANGGPPYFGSFRPAQPLSTLSGQNSAGQWKLEIKDDGTGGLTGTLNSWSLNLTKAVPASGLGESVADQATVSFRIFVSNPTDLLSHDTWTAVGPASDNGNFQAGRIGGIAIDPSDPSGNTVFIGGASGGVWKTTDFLTTDPNGPTWVPLTDFGPTFGINIGAIAIFPRNNDPNQSIIFAGTGEGDTATKGVGFLRSMDGGATWTLLDSTDNTLPFAQRDHFFSKNDSYAFKIVVDPKPTPNNGVILYAAMGGPNGGIWRSTDSGQTWGLLNVATGQRTANLPGDATDVVLDPSSGTGTSGGGGNLQIVYAAIRGQGVFQSVNQGQNFSPLLGGGGDPLIQDYKTVPAKQIPVSPPSSTPNGAKGRIELAKPALTGNALLDQIYAGWLYALVIQGNSLDGLYLTKDFGQNWTKIRIPAAPSPNTQGVPSNNPNDGDYNFLGGQGDYDVSLAIDPTNPNIVYLGGSSNPNMAGAGASGFIRVDATALADPHALVAFDNNLPDGGQLLVNTTGPVSLTNTTNPPSPQIINSTTGALQNVNYFNLIRDPNNQFKTNATIQVGNVSQFNNTGVGVTWIPFSGALDGSTDQHRLVTFVDPLTGHARLIIGDDQGVYTGVDNNGTFDTGIGTAQAPLGTRDGNLQITQFYYGSAQPSNLAAQIAQSLFYGGAQDNGGPASSSNSYSTGDLGWSGAGGDNTGVATDPTGSGTVYRFVVPADAGTNFFQVSVNGGAFIGRTFGLTTGPNDPQWGYAPIVYGGEAALGKFAVNPINGSQIVISSNNGTIYRTENQGVTWFKIAPQGVLDGSYAPAVAFGAPDPNAPNGLGNFDNFIYAGTVNGNLFVTADGGGHWSNIRSGLDGSGVQEIVPSPVRGSHAAYAVTLRGVYYTSDSLATPSQGNTVWTKINGNLFNLQQVPFGIAADTANQLNYLTSIQVDWRYVIPDPNNPGVTHPVLYVAGEGGVFRSLNATTASDSSGNNLTTWTVFPSMAIDQAPADGGYLPDAHVSDLTIAQGSVDVNSGRAIAAPGDPDLLLATTYGRGSFAIQLAPIVFPNSTQQPNLLFLDPATGVGISNGIEVTSNPNPIVDGQSEQSAFGNTVTVNVYDYAIDPKNPIGHGTTDSNGNFRITITTPYKTDGTEDGLHTLSVQATDQAGAQGNIATLTFILATQKPAPPTGISLDPTTDTGTLNNDGYTANNNSVNHLAPVLDVTGVEPGSIVQLFRNGVLVNTMVAPASMTGSTQVTVQVPDLNIVGGTVVGGMLVGGTPMPIPDNPGVFPPDTAPTTGMPYYTYTALQIDPAGNPSPVGSTSAHVIISSAIPATPTISLASDSFTGPSNSTTADNNSANHVAPMFQVVGVLPNSLVQLFRDDQFVGIVQTPPGNALTSIEVPDYLLGVIPDGLHSYTARQVDLAGNQGSMSNPAMVTIATAVPTAPTLTLDPSSTANTINSIAYTMSDNSAKFPAPVFDVSGVLPNAWVELFRNGTYVGFAQAGILGGTVKVIDDLAGVIPDSPTSPALTPYQYTVKQVDVAGNQGTPSSPATQVVVDTTAPLNPPVVLDMLSDTAPFGTFNSDGITNEKTLSHFPVFDVGSAAFPVELGATVNLYRNGKIVATLTDVTPTNGMVQISDSSTIPDGTYTYGAQERDLAGNYSGLGTTAQVTYLTVAPAAPQAPTLDPGSQTGSVSGRTSVKAPTFNVGGVVAGDVLVLLRDGTKVATIFNAQPVGGLVAINDPGPIADGLHSYSAFQVDVAGNTSPIGPATPLTIGPDAPASVTLVSDSGTKGDNITNVTTNLVFNVTGVPTGSTLELLRGGSLVKTLTNVQPVGGIVSITDPGPVQPDGLYKYAAVAIDTAGVQSPPSPALSVTIVTTVAQPGLTLDLGSDSGVKGDGITNVKNPTFDITSAAQGAKISLLRGTLVNGVLTGGTTVVATITAGPGGTAMITDPGPVPAGTYAYSVQQTDVAGNVSAASGQLTLTIVTAIPAAPALTLDPSSQSGSATITANPRPTIDVGSVQLGATVKLFRNGTLIKTVANASTTSFTFTEPNAQANGNVIYTAMQTDVAANASPTSTLTVMVNTSAAPAPPTVTLDPASESSPGVSGSTNVSTNLIFDVAGILPGATITLFRGGTTVATTSSPSGGTVMITDPGPLNPGSYSYTARQTSSTNVQSPVGPVFSLTINPRTPTAALVPDDFNGDGETDLAVFGPGANGVPRFSYIPSGGGATVTVPFGGTQDVFASGSFDGTGKTNVAVYGPGANGLQRLAYLPSSGGPVVTIPFGGPQDQFVSGDFNGDGRSDVAVYGYGRLAYIPSGGSAPVTIPFGQQGDVPVPGYYSGGVTTTFGVFRPSTDQWFIGSQAPVTLGVAGDIPVPGMYDTPGVTQIAVFRPSATGDQWIISGHSQPIPFGGPGDIPAPGEYDGGQKTEIAVFRPSTSQVFIYGHPAPISFGGPKDVPVSAPPEYQNVPISSRSIGAVAAPASATVSSASVTLSTAGSSLNLGSTAAMLSARTLSTGPARPVKVRPAAGTSKPLSAQGVTRLLSAQEQAQDEALSELAKVRLKG